MPDGAPQAGLGAARRQLAARLRAAGLEQPEADARLLMQIALGIDRTALFARDGEPLTAAQAETLAALAARRLAREPVARIVGEKEFWGLSFRLSPATLEPRPDSETVVETALALLGARRAEPLRFADLGTGTGALLLALLHECPAATGIGIDISAEAVATARANAAALGLGGRAQFAVQDFAVPLGAPVDCAVSNPPYIQHGALATLQPEVRLYDPPTALDGGTDGLEAYRAIAAVAPRLMRPGGWLVLELGAGQADSVAALLAGQGLAPQPPVADLAGIPRALAARLPP